jgi:hypothetical protein
VTVQRFGKHAVPGNARALHGARHANGRAEFFDRTPIRLDSVGVRRSHGWRRFFFTLVFLGLRRSPSHIHGPNWLGLATVLIFFAAGLLVLVRAWLRVPDKQANLPDDTPAVAVAIHWLAALTIITGLASIGAWIAFGPGPRQLSISLPVWGSLAELK